MIDIKDLKGIKKVENNSDSLFDRVYVTFDNGLNLSIIRGQYSYGGSEGLFEIMPSDSNVFDEEDKGDEVLGWLTEEQVLYYVDKMANIQMCLENTSNESD